MKNRINYYKTAALFKKIENWAIAIRRRTEDKSFFFENDRLVQFVYSFQFSVKISPSTANLWLIKQIYWSQFSQEGKLEFILRLIERRLKVLK